MDALGYTPDQLQDAAEDYVLAGQSGRLDEAGVRAAQGQETFGYDEWEAAVNRARATSWVGMPGFVGGFQVAASSTVDVPDFVDSQEFEDRDNG